MGKDGKNATRLTTTLTRQQYRSLEQLAARYDVKLAWLARRAIEVFLTSETNKIIPKSLKGTKGNG